MSRIMVFQHVSAEPLGVLDPLIRARGHRIRFYNFHRHPGAHPRVDRYDGLVVLGGPMNVTDRSALPHLQVEIDAIRRAVERGLPVLGICLGAQLLAHAFGGAVGPAPRWEIGWQELELTAAGRVDPVVGALEPAPRLFGWHGQTFDPPPGAELLVRGEQVRHQAFRLGERAYGFQFHLEVDRHLVARWTTLKSYRAELAGSDAGTTPEAILAETPGAIGASLAQADAVFNRFLDLVAPPKRRRALPSR